MKIRVTKNGRQKGEQKYAVNVYVKRGVEFNIHSNCPCVKTANSIKRNITSLFKELSLNVE